MREYRLRSPFAGDLEESFAAEPSARRVYTVSELTRQIKGILESALGQVWVEGELFEPKVYPSGHLWFDLKDSQSSLKSVMWRDAAAQLKFRPEHGLKVICSGRVDFYAQRGEIKFIADSLEPKGLGALQLAFEQLKEKLQKDGLFDEARKRPLPVFPERIGIVTSPRGAAIDDILKVIRGHVEISLYPSRVQGEEAARAVAHGIRQLNTLGDLDLLIVGRGGGSLEDLWAFNEEAVARAIFASRLPVISAVGHEKDVTIADLVSDLRAPTPTKAAELVLAQRRICLDRFAAALEEPAFTEAGEWLKEFQEQIEEFQAGLLDGVREPLLDTAHRIRVLQGDLLAGSPRVLILQQAQHLQRLKESLVSRTARSLEKSEARVDGLAGRLHALSPLAVLERGYSITFDEKGRIVKAAADVKPGGLVQTRLHRGRLTSRVESTTEKEE
ncbi:MAG: exodeoxyribonuclease VII large subunit [Candidatus Omnitrophica bacterium]|nr:exodeoxyribonuclease VII large subunit [Candidatus Omnitrophota bacterium]